MRNPARGLLVRPKPALGTKQASLGYFTFGSENANVVFPGSVSSSHS